MKINDKFVSPSNENPERENPFFLWQSAIFGKEWCEFLSLKKFRTTRRRSTPSEARVACVFDIAVQLERILTQNIAEIEALHSQLHRGNYWMNRTDTINSDYFKVE